jgi:hypothetical protein
MGIHSLPARRWARIGVVALLGLSFAVLTVTAGHANASIWRDAGATSAKKKRCKKKHKSAASAKKKKCKRKHAAPTPPAPVVTPPKGPIERIVLTWPGAADLDAHAWSNGLHDGWNETLNGGFGANETEIPGTTYTSSDDTPNRETIVQTNPDPLTPMTFALCYYPYGPDDGDVTATVKTVHTDGVTDTDEVTMSLGQGLIEIGGEGGPPDDVNDWCPSVF